MNIQIIAEAGSNHNGNLDLAYKLIDSAYTAKADIVKFQIINPKSLYVPYYWKDGEKIENIVFNRRKGETFTYDEWRLINNYANNKGIKFTASVFDKEGVDFLTSLNAPLIKLASSDLNNIELINYISKKDIPLIMSTGMSTLEEIEKSVNVFCEKGNIENLTVMHCVSIYPCPLQETRLSQLDVLSKHLQTHIGYSDHTQTSIAACIAASKGVTYIEKHFTTDKKLDGFDHKYAANQIELKEYINDIRNVENSILNTSYISDGEKTTKLRARRGLYLNKKLNKGDIIKSEDLVALRPTNKLEPKDKEDLIGLKVGQDINEFEPLILKDNIILKDLDNSWEKANSYWKNEMKEKKMLK